MATRKIIKDVRPARGELDVNDALRLAVEDQRFANALIRTPEKFQAVFNLRDLEVSAIKDALGGLAAADEYQYE